MVMNNIIVIIELRKVVKKMNKKYNLYIMVGLPGSGKSTIAKKLIKILENTTIVSRDEIRFNLLQENDAYFKYEKKVYNTFIDEINKKLKKGNVIADATHISIAARHKLISRISTDYNKIIAIVITSNPHTCVERNNQRIGRAKVPEQVIWDMLKNTQFPNIKEEKIDEVYSLELMEGGI